MAFSCRGRGCCPSCGGRRMSELAAHLVERVLPAVPIRQWVFTVPVPVRDQLAFDAGLTRAVRRVFLRTVFG
ncbi:MAG: transposase zinc-binding domain-containing protein [Candidatus Rokubacteria bacterium]|nr:transposase zinc-binding domain-containing protein [Candidatus Rokubacteria bacterium]